MGFFSVPEPGYTVMPTWGVAVLVALSIIGIGCTFGFTAGLLWDHRRG